jgi:hypothetical protein
MGGVGRYLDQATKLETIMAAIRKTIAITQYRLSLASATVILLNYLIADMSESL